MATLRKRLRDNAKNAETKVEILKTISAHITEKKIETCDLNSTNLSCWSEYFLNGSSVIKLILSRNRLKALGTIFGNVQQELQILEINDNSLKTFPDSVQFMKCLKELVAQRNPTLKKMCSCLGRHFVILSSMETY